MPAFFSSASGYALDDDGILYRRNFLLSTANVVYDPAGGGFKL